MLATISNWRLGLIMVGVIVAGIITAISVSIPIRNYRTNQYIEKRKIVTQRFQDTFLKIRNGDTLSDIGLYDLDLHFVQLSQLAQERVLLTFFSPSCGTCIDQIEMMKRVSRSVGDSSRFILISGNNPLILQEIRRDWSIPFQVLYDEDRSLEDKLGINSTPTHIILNPGLVVDNVVVGQLTEGEFRSMLDGTQ